MDADARERLIAAGLEILAGLPDARNAPQKIGLALKKRHPDEYPRDSDERRALVRQILALGGHVIPEAPPPARPRERKALQAAAGGEPAGTIHKGIEQTPRTAKVETVQATARAMRQTEQTRRPASPPKVSQARRWPMKEARPDYGRKRHLTGMVGRELQEAARDAAAALGLSLSQILEDALAGHLEQLERKHGGPFPRRRGALPRGPRRR